MNSRNVVLYATLLAGFAVQPLWAGAPLKGVDIKLGKAHGQNDRQSGAAPSASPPASPAPSPTPSPTPTASPVGTVRVKSHSNQNNN